MIEVYVNYYFENGKLVLNISRKVSDVETIRQLLIELLRNGEVPAKITLRSELSKIKILRLLEHLEKEKYGQPTLFPQT
jgi:hypothetical protein